MIKYIIFNVCCDKDEASGKHFVEHGTNINKKNDNDKTSLK